MMRWLLILGWLVALIVALLLFALGAGTAMIRMSKGYAVPMGYEPFTVCDNAVYPSLDRFPNDKNVCTPVVIYRKQIRGIP